MTLLLQIESSFVRSQLGCVLLPLLTGNLDLPRDVVFEVHLVGEHGSVTTQAQLMDSKVYGFVHGASFQTFVVLPTPPDLDLTGVNVFLTEA